MVLARGQQGSNLFVNLSAFRPCLFMNTLRILMGISAFLMKMTPIILFLIPPPFSQAPGALKGANTVLYHYTY